MKKALKTMVVLALCAAMLLSAVACAASENSANAKTGENASVENAGNGKKVYFAGPMFNQSEKDYNLKVATILEEYGYEVFLPQRDGIEAALLEGKTEQEMVEMIFALDEKNVKDADIIFMNLDGRVPDEGACVELGIGYACGKRCYGFKTDTRSVELGMTLNPMISGCMIRVFSDYNGDKMIEQIRAYLSENEL